MSRRNSKVNPVDELKVDQDIYIPKQWMRNYVEHVFSVCSRFGLRILSIGKCRSRRKGAHFYIRISPAIEANLANQIQWMLADDPARVMLNQARIESGLNGWSKLFEVAGRRLRTIYRTSGNSS